MKINRFELRYGYMNYKMYLPFCFSIERNKYSRYDVYEFHIGFLMFFLNIDYRTKPLI